MGLKLNPFTGTFDFAGSASSNYSRSSTLVVAASDSLDTTNADYVCDGTADEVQINQAISDLPTVGGRIILLEGNFNIAAAISMNHISTILEGQGNSTIITLANSIDTDVITIGSSGDNSKVRNLKIDGNMANQTTAGYGISINASAPNCVVEDCWIVNTLKANIYDAGASYTKILNNYCDTSKVSGGGANIEGIGINALVEGNICISGDFAGISVYNGAKTTITENIIITPTGPGIDIEVGNENCIVSNNFVYNPVATGIFVNAIATLVTGNNIFIGNNPTGAAIDASSNNACVFNNFIEVNGSNTAAVTGISITDGYARAENNEILLLTGYAHKGITSSGQVQLKIIGNRIDFGNSITSGSVGIEGGSGDESCSIMQNTINYSDTAVLTDGAFGYGQISNNIFFQCQKGINLSNSDELLINGNTFYCNSAGTYAIKGTGAGKDLTISNNIIYNPPEDGIYLVGASNCIISGNKLVNFGNGTDNTFSGIFLSGTSVYNNVVGNSLRSAAGNKPKYGIRENSSSDGPNVITGNVVLNAVTDQISAQHTNTDVSHNITT